MQVTGVPREHLEFAFWFLTQKEYVRRSDSSEYHITVQGAEYLEETLRASPARQRLHPGQPALAPSTP